MQIIGECAFYFPPKTQVFISKEISHLKLHGISRNKKKNHMQYNTHDNYLYMLIENTFIISSKTIPKLLPHTIFG